MMYCTGGVRCERASALLKQKLAGTEAEVFQLEGGIQRYMDAFPDGGFFEGTMHVFDRRGCVAPSGCVVDGAGPDVTAGPQRAKTLGRCVSCWQPWEHYQARWRCRTCDIPVLACARCQGMSAARSAVLCELCCGATPEPSPSPAGPAAGSTEGARSVSQKAAGASGKRRAEAVVEDLEQAASGALDSAAARTLLDRLKDLSGSRKLRASLHGAGGQGVATSLRVLFDKALPLDASLTARCIEVMDLWLHDRPDQERLHRLVQPGEMALQFLRLPDAPEGAVCAGLRCAQRMAEVPAARPALKAELATWASIVRARLEAAGPRAVWLEACGTARALAENLRIGFGTPEGGVLWEAVAAAAAGGDADVAAAALAAMWALWQDAKGGEALAAAGAAAAAMRAHSAPAVQRWGCALLLRLAEQGAEGGAALLKVGAVELAENAASCPAAAPRAARLLAALRGGTVAGG